MTKKNETLSKESYFFAEDAVKKKWKSLRDVFRNELKKIPKAKSGSATPSTFTSSWIFFTNMAFLQNQMIPRALTGSVCDTQTGADEDINTQASPQSQTQSEDYVTGENDDSIVDQHLEDVAEEIGDAIIHDEEVIAKKTVPDIPQENSSRKENFKTPLKRVQKRKVDSDMDTFLLLEKEKLQLMKANEQTNNDEDYHYLMSFLPSMKKMAYSTKMLFRLQMQELLYKCTVTEVLPYTSRNIPRTPSPLVSPTSPVIHSQEIFNHQNINPVNTEYTASPLLSPTSSMSSHASLEVNSGNFQHIPRTLTSSAPSTITSENSLPFELLNPTNTWNTSDSHSGFPRRDLNTY